MMALEEEHFSAHPEELLLKGRCKSCNGLAEDDHVTTTTVHFLPINTLQPVQCFLYQIYSSLTFDMSLALLASYEALDSYAREVC